MHIHSKHRVRITLDVGGARPPVIVITSASRRLLDEARPRATESSDASLPFGEFVLTLCRDAIDECREVVLCDCGTAH